MTFPEVLSLCGRYVTESRKNDLFGSLIVVYENDNNWNKSEEKIDGIRRIII